MRTEQELAKAQLILINKVLGLLKKYEEVSKKQQLKGKEMSFQKEKLSDELWGQLKQKMEELKSLKKDYWTEIMEKLNCNKEFLEDLIN